MAKMKEIFKNVRVIVLLAFVALALFSILPSFDSTEELAIRSVAKDSAAELAGIPRPAANTLPRMKEILVSINGQKIHTVEEYYKATSDITVGSILIVKTYKPANLLSFLPIVTKESHSYRIITEPIVNETVVGTEVQYVNVTDEETNETTTIEELVDVIDGTVLGTQDIGLALATAAKSNVRLGLDLEGGTRVMLEPAEPIDDSEMSIIIDNLNQRLNVYGISDITIRDASDLDGNKYILVEVPGANDEEVRNLIGSQGKFEAKIGNATAFSGGDDLKDVCRRAECSGIDTQSGCGVQSDGTWTCRFRFSITLSPEAAQNQADLTNQLVVVYEGNNDYLSEDLDLYLDDELVDALKIGSELQGEPTTNIAISGSGIGASQDEAIRDSLTNMKRLQTILVTGSLPVKLNIVKTDAISPILGAEFIQNAIFVGLMAIATVALIILIRYRSFNIMIPMAITMISEVIMILGFGSVLGWTLDLSAIAGIIIVAGTSVDHLVVITDSILKGAKDAISWKARIKNALSVIMIAYFTTATAMAFLLTTGGGLLRGFALTTILGITVGVLIARPAFAAVIKVLLQTKE